MRLWLDDERPAPDEWVWVKTAQEAIHNLQSMKTAKERPAGFWDHYGLDGFWTITHMSFDHDLADVHYDYWYVGHHPGAQSLSEEVRAEARRRAAKEMTGYDVLLWMAEHNVWPTEACYVHTHNAAAQKKMCGVINRYGPYSQPVRWTPYVA